MIVILQECLEATARGLWARVAAPASADPVLVEVVGDEARLRAEKGPLEVEFDFDAISEWHHELGGETGLFSTGHTGEVAIVGQVTAVVGFEASAPIVDLSLSQGIVSFEADDRTPELIEGDLLRVQVRGLRCYPTWV